MTMKRNLFAAILLVAAVAYACTSTEQPMPVEKGFANDGSIVANPTATIANFVYDAPSTKTVLEIDETTGATFTFANDDILGVFPYNPLQGDQVRFTVKVQTADACTFNGSGYALESGQKYAAYYPGDLANAAAEMMTKIPVSYAGQSQAAVDGETFDISAADYLVANGIEPASGVCEFKMSHLGTLLVMDVMPMSSGTFTELSLVADENLFTESGTVDLTQEITVPDDGTPAQGIAIANPVKVNKLTLALGTEGIELDGEQAYRFCMMIAPVDLTGKSAKIVLKGVDGADEYELEAPLNAKNYKQGYAYNIIAVVSEPVAEPVNLSANGTANCYIVSEAGDYYFNATVAGNGGAFTDVATNYGFGSNVYPSTAATTCAISGDGVLVKLNQNGCIDESSVRYEDGIIYFTATGSKGNAKLTLTNGDQSDNDNYVWTWVIWCTDVPGTVTINNVKILDRNIGATTAGVDTENPENMYGLYYQFGNPIGYTRAEFAGTRNRNGGYRMYDALARMPNSPYLALDDGAFYWFTPYASSAQNQLYGRLWGSISGAIFSSYTTYVTSKTCYDPCPVGYKVPSYAHFNGVHFNNSDGNGLYLIGTDGTLFFPKNGGAWKAGVDGVGSDGYARAAGAYFNIWLSAHNNRNMAYMFCNDASDSGEIRDHILTRGEGVRCVKE